MRWLATGVALIMASCSSSSIDVGLEVRRAALQEMVTMLEGPAFSYTAVCIAVDSAMSVDGVHEPPKGFTESLTSSRLELRGFGRCVTNPGLPGFTWRDTTAAARTEVLVGVLAADSIGPERAVVDVLWLFSGANGEDYRCVVLRDRDSWAVDECRRTGVS